MQRNVIPMLWTWSQLFDINMWMWRFGRTFPRQISVEQAVELQKKRVQESRPRGAETLRRRHDACFAVNDIDCMLYRILYRTRYI
jgi:hypothetical protein